jgi:hypothetical protein
MRKDQRRLTLLPARMKYAEPGSVTLPYHSVVRWLREAKRPGDWTVADVGFLAVMLGQFVSRESLFASGHFEEVEGELTLVVAIGGRQQFTFGGTVNPDRQFLGFGRGRVYEKECLETLERSFSEKSSGGR